MGLAFNGGELLDGYKVIRFLGSGGFGEVWLCQSQLVGDYRALKMIPTSNLENLEKEFEALVHYRTASESLRSSRLVSVDHVNQNENGLYYVMPLADGDGSEDPEDPSWLPMSLTRKIELQRTKSNWFTSAEVKDIVRPLLLGLQTLIGAGLVHRDVKPDNVLFFGGEACLCDISLVGEDAEYVTRRGTVGYATPSWYTGGHPDMYGLAATLFTVLTGNAPDKMGRSSFYWPPQGEVSLAASEREEWKRLHKMIRRATEEKVANRFIDFTAMEVLLESSEVRDSREMPKPWSIPKIMGFALIIIVACVATYLLSKQEVASTVYAERPQKDLSAKQVPQAKADKNEEKYPPLTEEQKNDYRALAGMIEGYMGDGQYANVLAAIEMLYATYPQSRDQPGYSVAKAMALIELGRVAEAKEELKKKVHQSPQLAILSERLKLWSEMGDLAAAEEDVTRVLESFGPVTLGNYMRADIRCQRGDFEGALEDYHIALKCNPGEPGQLKVVNMMWKPLGVKYPEYGAFLKNKAEGELIGKEHDDKWIIEVFSEVISDLKPRRMTAQKQLIFDKIEGDFADGNYKASLAVLQQIIYGSPVLAESSVISLYKALLYQRLGRSEDARRELDRQCHKQKSTRLISAKVALMSALERKEQARSLLTSLIKERRPLADDAPEKRMELLTLLLNRCRLAVMGKNYQAGLDDMNEARSLAVGSPTLETFVLHSNEKHQRLYPRYSLFLKAQSKK